MIVFIKFFCFIYVSMLEDGKPYVYQRFAVLHDIE